MPKNSFQYSFKLCTGLMLFKDYNLNIIFVRCNAESVTSSFPEPFEVSKHELYQVVTNCLGHVFSPSFFTQSSQKLTKKPKVYFHANYYMGLDDAGTVSLAAK